MAAVWLPVSATRAAASAVERFVQVRTGRMSKQLMCRVDAGLRVTFLRSRLYLDGRQINFWDYTLCKYFISFRGFIDRPLRRVKSRPERVTFKVE